jgi:erythromycin esterase
MALPVSTPTKRPPARLAIILAACLTLVHAQDRQARIAGLSKAAAPIRSIDPSIVDDDFADLKPLMTAIGSSRIVVLGEESHGDGATFLAKCRLIKFLHQRMSFDVLAWEAGLFNCHDMDAAVRDPAVPLEDAIGRGLYPIWASSAQVRPVFEYARHVALSKRPLEMAGFDHQFSGDGMSRWRDSMIAFIDKADPAILTGPLRSSLKDDASRVFDGNTTPAGIRSIAEKWKTLPPLLDTARPKLEAVHGAASVRMMRRTAEDAVISLEGLARFRESGGKSTPADISSRDRRMADNLIWLANDRYKGRRIIVWAAAFHTLREPSAIDLDFYRSVETMGHVAQQSFGRDMYTIGFTAADGKAGDAAGGQTVRGKTAEDGSLEDLLTHLGHLFVFADFRNLSEATGWLHQPISARFLQYSAIETDWTRQFDGVVFTRTMFPSSKGPMAPDGAVLSDPPEPRRGANASPFPPQSGQPQR